MHLAKVQGAYCKHSHLVSKNNYSYVRGACGFLPNARVIG